MTRFSEIFCFAQNASNPLSTSEKVARATLGEVDELAQIAIEEDQVFLTVRLEQIASITNRAMKVTDAPHELDENVNRNFENNVKPFDASPEFLESLGESLSVVHL